MTFLSPEYLKFGFILFIPIIIHLLFKRIKKKIKFPTFKFLKKIYYQNKKITKFKHFLLMLLRIALLLFLLLIFLRPTTLNLNILHTKKNNNKVIILDNSASMSYTNNNVSLLEAAKKKVIQLLNQFPENSSVSLIVFAENAEIICKNVTISETEKKLKTVNQTYGNSNLINAFNIMNTIPKPHNVYLISDMCENITEQLLNIQSDNILNDNIEFINVSLETKYNYTIKNVLVKNNTAEIFFEFINNYPDNLSLTLNNKINKKLSLNHIFNKKIHIKLPDNTEQIIFRINDENFMIDNNYYLSLENSSIFKNGVICNKNEYSYFNALKKQLNLKFINNLDDSYFYNTVFITEINENVINLLPNLVKICRKIVFFGSIFSSDKQFLNKIEKILPFKIEGSEYKSEYTKLNTYEINYSLFGNIPVSTLSAPKFFEYLKPVIKPGAEILAKFENGIPFIIKYTNEYNNQVYFCNSTINLIWNDLSVHSLFPVLMAKLSGYSVYRKNNNLIIGDIIKFKYDKQIYPNIFCVTPTGKKLKGIVENNYIIFGPAEIPGFYKYGNKTIAVNISNSESSIKTADLKTLKKIRNKFKESVFDKDNDDINIIKNVSDKQKLWLYCAIIVVLLSFIELLFSN